jgi:hypothetical protein
MQASTQSTVQHLWLTLLVVFVFCASMTTQICRAESQQLQIELESEFVPSSSEDDILTTGFMPGLFANERLPLSSTFDETLPPRGSDAYPSTALHGPPPPNRIV